MRLTGTVRRQSYDLLSLAYTGLFSPVVGLLKLPDSSQIPLPTALNGAAT
jgi:hypothetical protein